MRSEISQIGNNKYCMILLMCGIQKNKFVHKENILVVASGGRWTKWVKEVKRYTLLFDKGKNNFTNKSNKRNYKENMYCFGNINICMCYKMYHDKRPAASKIRKHYCMFLTCSMLYIYIPSSLGSMGDWFQDPRAYHNPVICSSSL